MKISNDPEAQANADIAEDHALRFLKEIQDENKHKPASEQFEAAVNTLGMACACLITSLGEGEAGKTNDFSRFAVMALRGHITFAESIVESQKKGPIQ